MRGTSPATSRSLIPAITLWGRRMQQKLDVDHIVKHFPARAKAKPKVKTAVVHPCSHHALLGPIDAAREGLIVPVLVGPRAKIMALAKALKLDILTPFRIELPPVFHRLGYSFRLATLQPWVCVSKPKGNSA